MGVDKLHLRSVFTNFKWLNETSQGTEVGGGGGGGGGGETRDEIHQLQYCRKIFPEYPEHVNPLQGVGFQLAFVPGKSLK